MERRDVELWLETHPDTVHTAPKPLLDECERSVKSYTHHDAWMQARRIAEKRLHYFEKAFGLPASEAFVAREVCHTVARELRGKEPHPTAEEEAAMVADDLMAALEPSAREVIQAWLHDLARSEEHEAWLRIVRFTDRCARSLIREAQMSDKAEWDFEHSYTHNAAKVARMLLHEYELHMQEEDRELALPTA